MAWIGRALEREMSIRAALAVVSLALSGAPALTQTPTFSSRVDAVRVDVLVTERGRLVTGLRPADFELLDNGVPQQVDLVTFERLPLNVVLVLDISDSVAGSRLQHLRAAGRALLDQLAADDEAALVAFSHAVTIRAPLTKDRARVRTALELESAQGDTSLADAAHTGLVLAESGIGRSLLILFSDGLDTASWLPAGSVLDTAKRTDVVAYCVATREQVRSEFTEELASITGGSRFDVESTKDLGAAFVRILTEFRQRYLVSYTPRGVPKEGWHRLEVRVKGRRLTVRARPGYFAR
jgi:VWFA-related protein